MTTYTTPTTQPAPPYGAPPAVPPHHAGGPPVMPPGDDGAVPESSLPQAHWPSLSPPPRPP